MGKNKISKNSIRFIDSTILNTSTYYDWLDRFEKIALSIFEWENLPNSMDAFALERALFYDGMAALFKDENYGFINTNVVSEGNVNIYGLPTQLNCYSFDYQNKRRLYSGLKNNTSELEEAILVLNNFNRLPTFNTLELFAYRLYEAERSSDTNIKAQKTPVLLLLDENQRLTMQNIYNQYDGNQPVIFGDKNQLNENVIRSIETKAPFVADKIQEYKKQILNEALTFLGINNIDVEKRERLISGEANSNNELINLNLQSYLVPRQKACKQFNELFNLVGSDKEIKVRVRSDLNNIIKSAQSIVNDFQDLNDINNLNIKRDGDNNV